MAQPATTPTRSKPKVRTQPAAPPPAPPALTRRSLPLDDIRLDGDTQPRISIDPDLVVEYTELMGRDTTFPAVVVFFDGTDHWLADGFHRYHAARLAHRAEIEAEIHRGSHRQAVLFSVGANASHGARRRNSDKRQAVRTLLEDGEWKRWSNERIAAQCCVSHTLVADIRRSLSEAESERMQRAREFPFSDEELSDLKRWDDDELTGESRTYITKHGTTATMRTANIGRAPVREPEPEPEPEQQPEEAAVIGPPPAARVTSDLHFSSKTAEHYTPPEFLAAVVACLGGIDLNPCSNDGVPNVPAARHYTRADNGLVQPWNGRVFMNPPYGREIDDWIAKLLAESRRPDGVTAAIALVASRTDTQWFRALRDFACCFVEGRLSFVGNDDPAPFPSAVFYLGDEVDKFSLHFEPIGDIWERRIMRAAKTAVRHARTARRGVTNVADTATEERR